MNEYEKKAKDFLTKHGITLKTYFVKTGKHFEDDTSERDIYRCTLKRNGQRLSIHFGQSLHDTGTGKYPTAYDLLACITKDDPGTFENFCGDFGYDTDSRKAEKIYKLVTKEWGKVSRFFMSEELEELAEIN